MIVFLSILLMLFIIVIIALAVWLIIEGFSFDLPDLADIVDAIVKFATDVIEVVYEIFDDSSYKKEG